MRFFSGCLLCFSLLLFSCKKDESINTLESTPNEYYPGQKGNFVIYDCDSTVYPDLNSATRTYKFYLKEIIDSVFTDQTGASAIRISRYKKWIKFDTLSQFDTIWHIQDVWWGSVSKTKVEIVEENQRIVKLVLPPAEGKTWNGNAFNSLGTWDFEYTAVDVPYNNGYFLFPNTLHVKQFDSGNILLYFKKYNEKYAKDVGMIYKEIEDYTWNDSNGTIIVGDIKYGFHYIMNAKEFGKE